MLERDRVEWSDHPEVLALVLERPHPRGVGEARHGDEILKQVKVPVLTGLTIGHTEDQLTLPEGVMATLDADRQELIIEESGVVA